MTNEYDTDLLIVGAGPIGLAASIIASKLGINNRVIERRDGLHSLPQAHVIKTRSMEIFRRLGIENEIHQIDTPAAEQQYIVWRTSMTGPEYGHLNLQEKKGRCDRFLSVSPTFPANLPQNLLEPIIFKKAKNQPGSKIEFNTKFLEIQQDASGVSALIEDKQGNTKTIRAKYLIGADGAGSAVRKQLGISFEGPPMLAQFCTIHLQSDFSDLTAQKPGVLYWILNPDVRGVFIVHNRRKSQVFMLPYDSERLHPSDFDMEKCRHLVTKAIGSSHAFNIVGIDQWTMSAQVASQYRKGRAFLAGDAAHRFPPTGGLGLNTGIQDVNNLVWKLKVALMENGANKLMDSYELECRPVAKRNCDRSAHNHTAMARVQELVGADKSKTEFQSSIDTLFSEEQGTQKDLVQAAINDQMKHFAAMDVEMAPTYEEGSFDTSTAHLENKIPPIEGYAPSIKPGSPLPHITLKNGASTLDCIAYDTLTLFIPSHQIKEWSQAVHSQTLPSSFHIKVVELSDKEELDAWQKVCGDRELVVLVRPDGHVGWVGDALSKEPQQDLATGVSGIFGEC